MSLDYIEPANFTLLKGQKKLTVYHWGDKDVNHYFCSICGIYPFHDSIYQPGKYRINLGCIDGLCLSELRITVFDGKNRL